MAMRKAITIYVDEGCYIEAVNAAWIVKREGSEEYGVAMQNFWPKGNNAIYVPIKGADGAPIKAWKEDIVLPSAQPEIIRCKDCKHWDGVDTCDVIDAPVWDNDFCSMAERRSDE